MILSDLHLGSPNCNTDGILETLTHAEFETLIINGDTYDNPNLHRLRRPHREVLSCIWDLHNRRKQVIWISGNHDAEILPLFNETISEFVFETPHGRIGVQHGHQFDNFIRKYPITTEIASRAYYYIQRCVKSNRFSEYVKYTSKSWLNVIKKVRQRALDYAAKRDFRFVVCGHVHHQEVYTEDDRTYINTGSFMDRSREGVLINWDKTRFDIAQPLGFSKPVFVEDFLPISSKPSVHSSLTIDPGLAAASPN
ncbi:MAG: UDP-2,3-diacylglucosamine diphosphatase [Calditrichaeota bacterium]|nr:UDP-2,3-diacylglucosamine diphosphatase [Calditrichota bacterium]